MTDRFFLAYTLSFQYLNISEIHRAVGMCRMLGMHRNTTETYFVKFLKLKFTAAAAAAITTHVKFHGHMHAREGMETVHISVPPVTYYGVPVNFRCRRQRTVIYYI
jgi:hypothetical protein